MPKPNRPLVRDGRLQAKKKRTDRSYLRPDAAAPDTVELDDQTPEEDAEETGMNGSDTALAGMPGASSVGLTPAQAPAAAAPVAPTRTPPARLPTAVRAIQQQGVRKRREFDIQALAVRDTEYAIHELRRIAVLATMVIITLVVLWIVLR
jgi:hypothetical protein